MAIYRQSQLRGALRLHVYTWKQTVSLERREWREAIITRGYTISEVNECNGRFFTS
jgi:hypothetical protein